MTTPQPEAEPSTAAQLIDELLAGGQAIDRGSFSVDTAAAAAKLDAFKYADRSGYLIPIAEAARGLDAGRVIVTTRGEDLSIVIEQVSLPDVEGFLAQPFAQLSGGAADRRARALGRLGVAIHMALGYDSVERVAVSYSNESELLVAEYWREQPARLVRREPGISGELQLLIDRPLRDRISLRGANRDALEQLRAAVEHSVHPFELDGQLISQRPRSWDYTSHEAGPGFRLEGGFESVGEQPSVIELWSEGVRVETLPGPGLAFRAAIHLDAPRRDLSQLKLVHDDTLKAALALVDDHYRHARSKLAADDANWPDAERPVVWSRARVDRVLERTEHAPELERMLEHQRKAGPRRNLITGAVLYVIAVPHGVLTIEAFSSGWDSTICLVFAVIAVAEAMFGSRKIAEAIHDDMKKQATSRRLLVVAACIVSVVIALL